MTDTPNRGWDVILKATGASTADENGDISREDVIDVLVWGLIGVTLGAGLLALATGWPAQGIVS